VHTEIGAVRVKVPRVRDRNGLRIRFHSALLPPYIRQSKSLDALLPWLYFTGVSTGDFSEALQALLGPEAQGLSPASNKTPHEPYVTYTTLDNHSQAWSLPPTSQTI
jgi:transposase-like protein